MIAAEQIDPPLRLGRPARPLSTLQLLKVVQTNSLAARDEELFDELFVERSFIWGRLVMISDSDGIRRVLQDNYDNYPRLGSIRRMFEFGSGTGIFCVEGDAWRRHRRLLNRTLEARALLDDFPVLLDMTAEMVRHLANHPPGREIDIGEALSHLVKLSTRMVFATDDREIEPMLDKVAHYPLQPSLLHFANLPGWLPFFRRYRTSRALAQSFEPMLDRLIAKRRDRDYAGRRDLVWRLVHARERVDEAGGLSDAELRDEIITLAATSYTVLRPLTWVWYLLALHPWAEEKLQAELDAVLGGPHPDGRGPAEAGLCAPGARRDDAPLPAAAGHDPAHRRYQRYRLRPPRRAQIDGGDHAVGAAPAPQALAGSRSVRPGAVQPGASRGAVALFVSAVRHRSAYLHRRAAVDDADGHRVAKLAARFRLRLVPGQHIEPMAWINLRPSGGIRMTIAPRAAAFATGRAR